MSEEVKNTFTARNVIYYILSIILAILGLRFVFRLLGANPENAFIDFLYSVSVFFLTPFQGIFTDITTNGLEAQSVFELQTLVAMVIYAIAAWAIVALIDIKLQRDIQS